MEPACSRVTPKSARLTSFVSFMWRRVDKIVQLRRQTSPQINLFDLYISLIKQYSIILKIMSSQHRANVTLVHAKGAEASPAVAPAVVDSEPTRYSGFEMMRQSDKQLMEWQLTSSCRGGARSTQPKLFRCLVCLKLYSKKQRRSHKYFHRKVAQSSRAHLKDSDGLYKCRVKGCTFTQTEKRAVLMRHLGTHSSAQLKSIGLLSVFGLHKEEEVGESEDRNLILDIAGEERQLSQTNGCGHEYLAQGQAGGVSHNDECTQANLLGAAGSLWRGTLEAHASAGSPSIVSLTLEISTILQDSAEMNLLWVESSSVFDAARQYGWQVSEYSVDKILSSRRQAANLWQEYKVLRSATQLGLQLINKIMNVTLLGSRLFISTIGADLDLKKLLEMGGHLPETQSAVAALIDSVMELHSAGIMHRNLSPSCLAISYVGNGMAFLRDFAWSASALDRDVCGALPRNKYCLRGRSWPAGSSAHDAWSIGAIILQMLTPPALWKVKAKSTRDVQTLASLIAETHEATMDVKSLLTGTILCVDEPMALEEVCRLYESIRGTVTYASLFKAGQLAKSSAD